MDNNIKLGIICITLVIIITLIGVFIVDIFEPPDIYIYNDYIVNAKVSEEFIDKYTDKCLDMAEKFSFRYSSPYTEFIASCINSISFK